MVYNINNDVEGILYGYIINVEGIDECKYSFNFLYLIKIYLLNFKCV